MFAKVDDGPCLTCLRTWKAGHEKWTKEKTGEQAEVYIGSTKQHTVCYSSEEEEKGTDTYLLTQKLRAGLLCEN